MPARSNDFQAVVYFIKKNLAADATVTESAQLRDRVTGQLREVDVVVAGHIVGHPMLIGIECRGRSRKDAVSWVEEMRAKHDDLPTDRLVLVSASGFSKAAVVKAQHYGIETVTPGKPIANDGPLARLRHPQVEFRDVTHDRLVALHGTVEFDGQPHTSELTPDHVLFAADGSELGSLADLVKSTFDGLNLRSAVAAAQDGDQYLVIDVARPRLPQPASDPIEVYLQRESHPPHLLPLRGLRIVCASRVDVRPVPLTAGELQGAAFAYGSGQVAGGDALLVFTHDSGHEHLSVRFTDATGATTDWTADPERQELVPHTPPA
ncbi:hypothetical protein AB0L44_46735 [Nonomuraea wenchangensis]|uniref:hypothetical protein n=1 Tax=Nonomuraea wenchangensis TaxID=568860 RepID=UPI0034262959